MPGASFAQNYSPLGVPLVGPELLGGGSVTLSGTGTPPAAALQAGDLVVRTTKSTLTSGGYPVIRMLLAADKTADYKEGGTTAGILGIIAYGVSGNGSGQATGGPSPAPLAAAGADLTPNFSSIAQGDPQDSITNRSWLRIIYANEQNIFRIATTTMLASPLAIGTQVALTLSTASGVTTYTVNQTTIGAGNLAVATVVGVDTTDLLYGQAGGHVFIKFLPAFCQINTALNYSTN